LSRREFTGLIMLNEAARSFVPEFEAALIPLTAIANQDLASASTNE
jgi:hypothetical protein